MKSEVYPAHLVFQWENWESDLLLVHVLPLCGSFSSLQSSESTVDASIDVVYDVECL